MKSKNILLLSLIFTQVVLFGQVKTPDASSAATIIQTIGFTETKIEYNRPQLKGRNMFKELTRPGEVWRTGANMSTRLTTNEELIIEGKVLPAGAYSLYSIPGKKEWTLIINKKISWGTQYDVNEDLMRITVPTKKNKKKAETFAFYFADVTQYDGLLGFKWGKVRAEFKLSVDIKDEIVQQIEKVMMDESKAQNNDFYSAAEYYINNGLDANKALSWATTFVDKAGGQYWAYGLMARAQANAGNFSDAKSTAMKVVNMAKEAGNQDYVNNFTKLLKLWGKK